MMAASCIGDNLTGRLLYQLTGTPFQFLTDRVLGSKNIPLETIHFWQEFEDLFTGRLSQNNGTDCSNCRLYNVKWLLPKDVIPVSFKPCPNSEKLLKMSLGQKLYIPATSLYHLWDFLSATFVSFNSLAGIIRANYGK